MLLGFVPFDCSKLDWARAGIEHKKDVNDFDVEWW